MSEIRPLRADELPRAAAFLARLNRSPEHHIGFCGTAEAEILNSLQHDFGDVPAADAFVALEQGGNLTGLLGFDADLKRGSAEIWGPFADPQAGGVPESLWQSLRFPTAIHEALLFCNVSNTFCADFAAHNGFVEGGFVEGAPTQILLARRSTLSGDALAPKRLAATDAEAFVALHDTLFPGTYYDGREILGYLDAQHQVLTAHDEAELCGYVYAEVSPAFGEASLEFVGVAPRARNEGIGTRLVREALAWVFSFAAVAEVTLVVNTRREAALRLYRAAGFGLEHEMRSFLETRT